MAPMSTLPLGKFSATISRSLGPAGGRGSAFAKTAAEATTNVIKSALIIGLVKRTDLPTRRLTFPNLPTLHYTKTHPKTLPDFSFAISLWVVVESICQENDWGQRSRRSLWQSIKRKRAHAQRTGCIPKRHVMSPIRPRCGIYVTMEKANRQRRNSAGRLADSARLS